MTIKDWEDVVDEEPRPENFRVTKRTLINTLRFSSFRGDISPEYANRRIAELEAEEAKEHSHYNVFRRAYDYVAGFFRR